MSVGESILRSLHDPKVPRLIFVAALVVRLVMLAFLHDAYYTVGMSQGELARNLAEGRGFVINRVFADSLGNAQWEEERLIDVEEGVDRFHPDDAVQEHRPFIAYMMPGQGMLLAVTYLVTGSYSYLPLQIVQAFADALGVYLLIAIGSLLFSRDAGLVAAMLFAVYIPEARLAISATRDAWMPVLFLAMAYGSVRWWKSSSPRDAAWLGVTVALAAYFRSEVMLLPVCVGAVVFIAGMPLRRVVTGAGLSLGIVVLAILPWTMRNVQVFDRLIPTNSGLWVAMWQSFGEYENDFGAVNNDVVTVEQMRREGHTETFDSPEYDALFRPKVLRVMREEPGWVVWTMLRRLARIPLQMHAWGLPITDDLHGRHSPYPTGIVDQSAYGSLLAHDPLRLVVHAAARGVNLALFAAVAVWFFRFGRGSWRAGLVLLSVPAYNIFVHVVIGVHARYILPTNALQLVFLAPLLISFLGRHPAVGATGPARTTAS